MGWTPTVKVLDLRHIANNLLAYIEANQADALEWAYEAPATATGFLKFYKSAKGRLSTIFPCLMILEKGVANDLEDAITGVLTIKFEAVIAGADADTLADDAVKYGMALESMLANIPKATLGTADDESPLINPMTGGLILLETEYDESSSLNGTFFQVFQTKASYQLIARGY